MLPKPPFSFFLLFSIPVLKLWTCFTVMWARYSSRAQRSVMVLSEGWCGLFSPPGAPSLQCTLRFCLPTTKAPHVSPCSPTTWKSARPWGLGLFCSICRWVTNKKPHRHTHTQTDKANADNKALNWIELNMMLRFCDIFNTLMYIAVSGSDTVLTHIYSLQYAHLHCSPASWFLS